MWNSSLEFKHLNFNLTVLLLFYCEMSTFIFIKEECLLRQVISIPNIRKCYFISVVHQESHEKKNSC